MRIVVALSVVVSIFFINMALTGLTENAGILLAGISTENAGIVLAGVSIALLTLIMFCTLMFRPQWFWKMISFISFKANKTKSCKLPSPSGKRRTTIRSKGAAGVSGRKSGKRISQSSSHRKTQNFEGRSVKKKQNFVKGRIFEKKATKAQEPPSKEEFNKEFHGTEYTKGSQARSKKPKKGEVGSMAQKPFPKRNEDNKVKISLMKKDCANSAKQVPRPVHKHPQKIKHVTKEGYYYFTLTAIGGILRLNFIVLHFPEKCVKKEKKLILRQISRKDNKPRGPTLITPEIELIEEGASAARFECPIGLEIRPSMLPKDPVKSVQVEVTDNFNEVTWIEMETLKLQKHQQFVSFKLQRFARVRVVCDSSTPSVKQHYLFHVLFVKRPTGISDPRRHILKILIYSDHAKMCTEAAKVLQSPSVEVITDRELIQTRPPCTFSASLVSEGMDASPESVDFDVDTVDQKVLKTLTITIEKGDPDEEIPTWKTVDLHYTAWIDKRGPPTILPFRWSVPTDYRGSSCTSSVCCTFNASSEGAVDSDAYSIMNPRSLSDDHMQFHSVSEELCVQLGGRRTSYNTGATSSEGTQVVEVSNNPEKVDKPASIDDCIIAALQKDYQQKAVASLTVGREGDEFELLGFKVIIPRKAVKKETKFRMSVDNNPENYPENEDALAPILEVSHHLKFDRPVTVKIRTYMSAARGRLMYAHILRRECKAGSTWKHYKNVLITEQNEVEFEVVHFSKHFLSIGKWFNSKPVLHYFKDVYIQRGTGTILIVHFPDEKSAQKVQEEVKILDYQKAALTESTASTVGSKLEVRVECKQPEGVSYNPRSLTVEGFSKRNPRRKLTLSSDNFPKDYEGVFKATLTVEPSKDPTPADLTVNIRALEGSSHSTAPAGPKSAKSNGPIIINNNNNNNYGDNHCDKRQTRIARTMADSGGVVNITKHVQDTTNTQNGDAKQQQG